MAGYSFENKSYTLIFQAEGLGMGAELASGDNQNLNDADFTCSLFRFLQLTCEGHNLGIIFSLMS